MFSTFLEFQKRVCLSSEDVFTLLGEFVCRVCAKCLCVGSFLRYMVVAAEVSSLSSSRVRTLNCVCCAEDVSCVRGTREYRGCIFVVVYISKKLLRISGAIIEKIKPLCKVRSFNHFKVIGSKLEDTTKLSINTSSHTVVSTRVNSSCPKRSNDVNPNVCAHKHHKRHKNPVSFIYKTAYCSHRCGREHDDSVDSLPLSPTHRAGSNSDTRRLYSNADR